MPAKMPAQRRPPVALRMAVATATWVVLATGARPALADSSRSAKGPSDEARADAEKRLDEGLDRYAKGDYEGARLAFAQAYAVLASIDLLYNLMRAELKSNHPLEALVHIHQLLRNPNATPDDRAKVERLLEEANRTTGHVACEAPDGAEVFLDHVPSGEAPVTEPYDVIAGRHVVEVKANGTSRMIEVDAPAGQLVTVRFSLEGAETPNVSAPIPVPLHPLPPHREAAKAPEAPLVVPPPPRHESSARIVVPIVVGALAVAAIGVGAGLGVASQNQESNASSFRTSNPTGFCGDRSSAPCAQYQGILNSQQEDTNVARAMYVTGAVLAVGAVVTYLVWPHGGKERSAWVAPTLGGLAFGGSF